MKKEEIIKKITERVITCGLVNVDDGNEKKAIVFVKENEKEKIINNDFFKGTYEKILFKYNIENIDYIFISPLKIKKDTEITWMYEVVFEIIIHFKNKNKNFFAKNEQYEETFYFHKDDLFIDYLD